MSSSKSDKSRGAEPVIDANLAVALDALLAEESVTRAAARLHTSPAAMSRTLARLRRILQDPLLVRAGQRMVPTPRAQALREETAAVVRRLGALLAPGAGVDPAALRSTFTLQVADLVGVALAPGMLRLAEQEAPGISLRFRAEELEAGPALREGRIDLEVGVIDHVDPETRIEEVVTLRMAAAVRPGHPLAEGPLTPDRLAAADHVVVSRRGRFTGPLDTALAERDLRRRVAVVLPSHLAAMTLAARSDFVCLVPTALPGAVASPLTDAALMLGLRVLDIPLPLPPLTIGMAWHPRQAADGGHRWLRKAVRRTLLGSGDSVA
ncbi:MULTISPECIES: LysR family transcriptional regulator [unclassified Streptomyces]|uniref:LysR family transcriptional regulator n=1 Tax=Streptomyces TaxID=1883 RepID=UPI00136AE66E|nr:MULTISPECIES: LysR family transcriptional regulator [unclassified Streptomyces]NEA02865.1 LysR family transcriptional regulator [Streptomyces sp. SID10116]MYY83200.1 LysR family transcriptional regulator [Streptomyces sp. SID335]MYZ14119.1 LysR family transcriptional regulator [Streptomyces sp. SID337]NDZ85849.1 LysR family transcriptional regulator [Streptomyces sp. SID10115]NEB45742.1 LysR family transcriptional regulator [Streptomyces sp. SID339]